MTSRQLQTILRRLRQQLVLVLGAQLEDVILYGSQARRQARRDSDIDVLIVVKDASDYGSLIKRTSELVAALSLEYGVVISRAFVSREHLERDQSPFMQNVRREGISV